MRNIFFPIFLLALLTCSCNNAAVADNDDEVETILSILESFQEALSKGDLETMKSITSNDFQAFDSGQELSLEELKYGIDSYTEMGLIDTKYSSEILRSEIYPENALLIFRNTVNLIMEDREVEAKWIGSCNFVLSDVGWKIKYLHTTSPVFRGGK